MKNSIGSVCEGHLLAERPLLAELAVWSRWTNPLDEDSRNRIWANHVSEYLLGLIFFFWKCSLMELSDV